MGLEGHVVPQQWLTHTCPGRDGIGPLVPVELQALGANLPPTLMQLGGAGLYVLATAGRAAPGDRMDFCASVVRFEEWNGRPFLATWWIFHL